MSYQLEMNETFECKRHPQEVFDYIVDFTRIHEWDHSIVSSKKITAGKVGLGSEFALIYAMGLRRVPINYQITEYRANEHAVLVGNSKNFDATDTVTIRETEQGCHVTWNAKIEFRGAVTKLLPLMESKITKAGVQTIRDLELALQDDFAAPKLGPLQSLADRLIVPGVLGFSKYGYRSGSKDWKPVTASMRNKHVLITGATSGLGLATAQELAHLGARLTLVARNREKAEQVVKNISAATGNEHLTIELADLSEMTQVVALGQRLLDQAAPIDVLINNAGALLNPRQETKEGIEASFALLLLGPTILTDMLHPLLASAKAARVINVSSGGMYATGINLANLESVKGDYRGADAYARAKRGLVIMGERWAERWASDGITVHNMHPGWAYTPGVEEGLPEFTKLTKRILRTPEQGADTIIWLANASEAAKTTGLFWLDRVPHATHFSAKTRETAEQRDELARVLGEYRARFISSPSS